MDRFEQGLQEINPNVSLPYWDWSDPKATDAVLSDDFLGLAGFLRRAGELNPGKGFPVPTNDTGIQNLDNGRGRTIVRSSSLTGANLESSLRGGYPTVAAQITIRIALQGRPWAKTHYWIRNLEVID